MLAFKFIGTYNQEHSLFMILQNRNTYLFLSKVKPRVLIDVRSIISQSSQSLGLCVRQQLEVFSVSLFSWFVNKLGLERGLISGLQVNSYLLNSNHYYSLSALFVRQQNLHLFMWLIRKDSAEEKHFRFFKNFASCLRTNSLGIIAQKETILL